MNYQRAQSPEEILAGLGAPVDPTSDAAPCALWCDDGGWVEAEIPRRQWIAPGYLLRGAVTLIAGAAGVSKSSIACCYAVALALGQPFHRFRPTGQMRVLVYNVEDDLEEQRRRLSAALREHGTVPASIAGRVRRIGPLGVGTLLALGEGARLVETPAWHELVKHVEEFRPDVLVVDPFVELHSLEENDNSAIRTVMARLRALAIRSDLALIVVHHARKGANTAGDPDAARGASAIVGAARIALTVTPMTEDEARAFGLDPDTRRHLFRVDGSKSNYAPLTAAEWFERVTVVLDNQDAVAAPRPWNPPVDAVTLDARTAIEAGIAAGSPAGPWSAKLSNDARSIRHLLAQHGVATMPGQRQLLRELQSAGFVVAAYKRSNNCKAQGFRTPDGQPARFVWVDDEEP